MQQLAKGHYLPSLTLLKSWKLPKGKENICKDMVTFTSR